MDTSSDRAAFVVTGATSGIGLSVARLLQERGSYVIGIGHAPQRCLAAEKLLRTGPVQRASAIVLCADLSLQSEVTRVADCIREALETWRMPFLNGLINNAAAVPFWQTFTSEGFDLQWALNHLAPFLLTTQLLPLLKCAPFARVVTVSSGSHYHTRLKWDDIQLRRHYNPLRAYNQSKLANVLFTVELDRRLRADSNVRAFAADPGLVNTEIGLKSNSFIARRIWDLRRRGGIQPEVSALGIVFLATDPSIQDAPDIYWKHGKPKLPDPYALNLEAAGQLWRLSSQMCGLSS